jgi:hypothetical protein
LAVGMSGLPHIVIVVPRHADDGDLGHQDG